MMISFVVCQRVLATAIIFLFLLQLSFSSKVLEAAVKESGNSDVTSIYRVARAWYENESTQADAVELLHYLADSQSHVLSCAKLGHHYASTGNNNQAIKYFSLAGENGPHHASLYNVGRLLTELGDWIGALAYLKAAATLSQSYPSEYISNETTESSKQAYNIISERLSREELTVVQAADIFLYGSLQDLSDEAESLWSQAVMGLVRFNQTFVDTNGQVQDEGAMKEVANALRLLWETYGSKGLLSNLQTYILLDNMNDMLGPLAGLDDAYVPMAAGYAEALATLSIYCWEHYAIAEDDSACFNGAAASAISYYRRAGDSESAKRVLLAAQQHPRAATHWKKMDQTPRVFHTELASKAWWTASDFSAAQTLYKVYKQSSKQILKELQAVKVLQEGRLRGGNVPLQSVEVEPTGSIQMELDDEISGGGFQRIFTPYIGVRTEESETRQAGAGGWAEFGPLYDGLSWHQENCKVVPTICNALKNDPSLCTSRTSANSIKQVWQLCGADTVVTILRLRPGTTILPHCGTTNSRLIMHFALEGADGLEFTVGGQVVKNYNGGDGNPIVFDDSFEHSVYHGGSKDRFVVLAVLAHPELF